MPTPSAPVTAKDTIKANLKYVSFGIRLWKLREQRKIRSKDMAELLAISFADYRRFESGERMPDRRLMLEMARILEIDLGDLMRFKGQAPVAHTHTSSQPASQCLPDWEAAEKRFCTYWLANQASQTELDPAVTAILSQLKQASLRLCTMPVLPLSLYLILDALADERNKKLARISDIKNFVLEGESLAGYVARDPYLGPFCFMAANRLFLNNAFRNDIETCLDQLTVAQFSDLLFFATAQHGIGTHQDELPALQQFLEFSSLSVLMVRELKTHLPANICYQHLYQAALLQSMGTYTLFTLFEPLVHIDATLTVPPKAFELKDKKQSFLNLVNWDFHAVISGMLAANWGLAPEVVDALSQHHAQPLETVSPLCAALKLVNFFVDCGFPEIPDDEMEDLLKKYPQLSLSSKALSPIARTMHNMSAYLIEKSSSIIEVQKTGVATGKGSGRIPMLTHRQPRNDEFRFDPDYLRVLSIDCLQHFSHFVTEKTSPAPGESVASFGERIQNQQLAMQHCLDSDLATIAARFQLATDEIRLRLHL